MSVFEEQGKSTNATIVPILRSHQAQKHALEPLICEICIA